MQTTKQYRGMRVMDAKKDSRKLGKIDCTVFHPTEPRVVGFIVKRPDALMMIQRADLFRFTGLAAIAHATISSRSITASSAPSAARLPYSAVFSRFDRIVRNAEIARFSRSM